jgi:alginate O-acetyltransferase complex protein AlgI
MGFEDANFFVFVTVVFALYYLVANYTLQLLLLVASSLFFYAYGQPHLLILLLACCIISAVCSLGAATSPTAARRRQFAFAGVALNLLALIFFKYDKFLLSLLGVQIDQASLFAGLLALPLPIGISFYTFHGISLVVDSLKSGLPDGGRDDRSAVPQRHLLKTTLYLVFFPQLISGPISKAKYFWPQIGPKRLRDVDYALAFKALVYGYFLKSVIANNLQDVTGFMSFPLFLSFSSRDLLVLLIGYSVQIFADFAGYSLLAIGFGALFGYRLPDNFNMPYISQTFSEFWTRWHISLSSFLREYLYFPLGGNRKGEVRTYVNLMIVMVLGGLWHGAAVSYAVWGGAHGLALMVERSMRNRRFYTSPHPLVCAARMAIVFFWVTFAWLLFKLPDFSEAVAYLRAIASNTSLQSFETMQATVWFYAFAVIAIHLWYLAKRPDKPSPAHRLVPKLDGRFIQPLALGSALALLLLNIGKPSAFIYFQF